MFPASAPGLYVHVPFCRSKCNYCGFFSETAVEGRTEWVDAALLEAQRFGQGWGEFDTVYVGGGTPSILPDAELDRLLEGLRARLKLGPAAESTLEANPADVNRARAERWRALAVRPCPPSPVRTVYRDRGLPSWLSWAIAGAALAVGGYAGWRARGALR